MRKAELRVNEQMKYEVIKKLVDNKGNIRHAAAVLDLSIQQIYRLIDVYKLKGKYGFVHGNRTKSPATKLPDSQIQTILSLYQEQYLDVNFTHFHELLQNRYQIVVSYYTVHTILSTHGFLSPKAHRATRRKRKQQLKLLQCAPHLVEEQMASAPNHILDLADAHPRKARACFVGELLQLDASHHLWFGTQKSHLHIAIDDATGQILGAYFTTQETLHAYYQVFYQILVNYGIPAAFLTDNRTIFMYQSKKDSTLENDTFTQFGFACHQLGVALSTTSVPQAKGRVERAFGTLQGRLPVELRLAGVQTIEQANQFLTSYIKSFNNSFALPLNITNSCFETQVDLSTIHQCLSIISKRTVDNGSCIKLANQYYRFLDSHSSLVCVKPKTSCFVLKTFDLQLLASIDDTIYFLDPIPTHKRQSSNFSVPTTTVKSKAHIPPMSHPWKAASFQYYLNKRKHPVSNNANV